MLKDQIKNKIHSRTISLSSYPLKKSEIIVEGILLDERFQKVFTLSGDVKEPGVVHHIEVRLLICDNPLRIVKAEAEMPHIPMDECRESLELIGYVEGVEIGRGFSKKVRTLTGGTKGCTHLAHLLTVMSQEIVHGWMTDKRKKKRPLPKSLEHVKERDFLINSCRMWTENGPKMRELKQAFVKPRSCDE